MRPFQSRPVGNFLGKDADLTELLGDAPPRTEPLVPGGYKIVGGSTYGECLAELIKNSSASHPVLDGKLRPLTVFETATARIQYPELLELGLDTCTGVAYSSNGKFKLIPISRELCSLPEDFNPSGLQINYSSISSGVELERDNTYGRLLSLNEVLAHRFWLAGFENNLSKLTEYRDLVFNKLAERQNKSVQEVKGMGVWLLDIPQSDELRGVWLSSININSSVSCDYGLDGDARFLLGKPPSSGVST